MASTATRVEKRRLQSGSGLETLTDITAVVVLVCGCLTSCIVFLLPFSVLSVFGFVSSLLGTFVSYLLLRCLAEHLRLQKCIAGLDFEGRIRALKWKQYGHVESAAKCSTLTTVVNHVAPISLKSQQTRIPTAIAQDSSPVYEYPVLQERRRGSSMRILLLIHSVLIVLAGTSYTVLTFPLGYTTWNVNLYQYWWNKGFGQEYVSPYSNLDIGTYIAAFLVGFVAYWLAIRSRQRILGFTGLALSAICLVCFVNEAFQVSQFQYHSWILASPPLMLLLAIATALQHKWISSSTAPTNLEG